jgi:putative copper export protein
MTLLAVSMDTVRVFLHVLAATVWVGGQLTLGALVPALRGYEGVPKVAARRFNVVAWPAFAVLVLTGVWNIVSLDHPSDAYRMTLNVKMAFVVLSGVAAFLHTRATSKRGLAIWGGLGALGALVALFFGVQLG